MLRKHIKLSLAVLVACVGVFMVARLLLPRGSSKPARAPVVKPASPELAAVLTGGYDTHPTTETVEADIANAVRRASVEIGSVRSVAVPADRRVDLSTAFGERLAAVINPDYMRDLRARSSRGQAIEVAEPDEETLDLVQIRGESFKLLPMDTTGIEVRPIFEQGQYVATQATSLGFGTGETRLGGRHAFPMAGLDPVEDKLDIVEVRLPMEIPVPVGRDDEKRQRAIVGFQFVWSKERKQWIPWVIKTYGDPNYGSFGFPF